MTVSIAEAFVDARRTGLTIDAYPGAKPDTLEAAYRIQDDAIARGGRAIGGWKVGRIALDLVDRFGTNRIAGPIFSDAIVEAQPETPPTMPVLAGFAAVEAELMLRVGAASPPPGLRIEDVPHYVDTIRFGLEVASSPFPGINDFGPTVTISDFGNNFGLVLGPVIEDWRSCDLLTMPVTLAIDGRRAGSACLAEMLDGPFGAFRFLTDCLYERGRMLAPGQWVSTGAITGVHDINPGQRAEASFGNVFNVACHVSHFVPASVGQVDAV